MARLRIPPWQSGPWHGDEGALIAYAWFRCVTPDGLHNLGELRDSPPPETSIDRIDKLIGPYAAVARVTAASFESLSMLTDQVRGTGLCAEWSTVLYASPGQAPEEENPDPPGGTDWPRLVTNEYDALIQISIDPGLWTVYHAVQQLPTYVAVAVVTGSYQLLLQLGSEGLPPVQNDILSLYEVAGILDLVTTYVANPHE